MDVNQNIPRKKVLKKKRNIIRNDDISSTAPVVNQKPKKKKKLVQRIASDDEAAHPTDAEDDAFIDPSDIQTQNGIDENEENPEYPEVEHEQLDGTENELNDVNESYAEEVEYEPPAAPIITSKRPTKPKLPIESTRSMASVNVNVEAKQNVHDETYKEDNEEVDKDQLEYWAKQATHIHAAALQQRKQSSQTLPTALPPSNQPQITPSLSSLPQKTTKAIQRNIQETSLIQEATVMSPFANKRAAQQLPVSSSSRENHENKEQQEENHDTEGDGFDETDDKTTYEPMSCGEDPNLSMKHVNHYVRNIPISKVLCKLYKPEKGQMKGLSLIQYFFEKLLSTEFMVSAPFMLITGVKRFFISKVKEYVLKEQDKLPYLLRSTARVRFSTRSWDTKRTTVQGPTAEHLPFPPHVPPNPWYYFAGQDPDANFFVNYWLYILYYYSIVFCVINHPKTNAVEAYTQEYANIIDQFADEDEKKAFQQKNPMIHYIANKTMAGESLVKCPIYCSKNSDGKRVGPCSIQVRHNNFAPIGADGMTLGHSNYLTTQIDEFITQHMNLRTIKDKLHYAYIPIKVYSRLNDLIDPRISYARVEAGLVARPMVTFTTSMPGIPPMHMVLRLNSLREYAKRPRITADKLSSMEGALPEVPEDMQVLPIAALKGIQGNLKVDFEIDIPEITGNEQLLLTESLD